MSLFARIRWASACGLVCGVVLFQSGDVLTYWLDRWFWPATAIPVHMVLQVGSSWSGAARNALSVWNGSGSRFRFSSGITSARQRPSCTNDAVDRRNVVVWSATFCGEAWNQTTLAVTRTWFYTSSEETIDSDVIFNSNRQWGLYRGNLSRTVDFERVAIHEFGHVLGLDHPDDHGQSVNAIMNAYVSNIDTIQADDIAGAIAIYGGTARPPTGGCTLEDFGIVSAGNTVVRRTGTLGMDCVSPNYSGVLARYYSFRLDRTSNIRIDMVSSTIDSWLTLRRGANIRGAQLAFDNDGGSIGLNARIDRSLEAGIYTIEATSLRAGETGSFSLALTVVPTGLPPSEPGRTNPTTLDLTCHGYDEGATRAYNCIPEPSQQRYMQPFVPAVGSACDGGSIAEFPAGRIVFQIRCRDNSPGQSAPWSYSGQGPASFTKPIDTPRVWLRTSFSGSSVHLSVWCRAPQESLVVNELLGTSWGNDGTNGIYGMTGCSEVEVDTAGGEDLHWWFTQDLAATALTPPRSWEQVTGAGSALGAEALQDLATAAELERLWRQPGRWQMNPGQGASTRGAVLTSDDDRVAKLVASKPDDRTDALDGGIVRGAVRTSPLTLDFTCHGYDEGATRAYNCIPAPSQQHLMRTFVPVVGSACDQGSIAEFPAGRIVFQIRCRDNSPGQSAAWSYSGQGPASFAKPIDTPRVWLRTSFSGSSVHLSVWCRAPQESLVVNELLGTSWGNDGTNGIYGMAGCSEVEVDTAGGEDLHWWFTQELAATALTPPRSWEQVTGAGRALPAEGRQDLATAVELERLWPRHGR